MFFDCHTHSNNSDGRCSVHELCEKACEKSLDGIIITDHANMNYYNERNTYSSIKNSIADIENEKKNFKCQLKVLRGIELGEYLIAPKKADEVLSLNCYDAILCAIHHVPSAGWSLPYNKIDFSTCMSSSEEINEDIDCYFDLKWLYKNLWILFQKKWWMKNNY